MMPSVDTDFQGIYACCTQKGDIYPVMDLFVVVKICRRPETPGINTVEKKRFTVELPGSEWDEF